MNEFETIKYNIKSSVATISLNRPKVMNAINQQMRHDLLSVIKASEDNSEVRVIVIRAEGNGFSSGTDLSEGLAGFDTIDDQIQKEYKPVIMNIAQSQKTYIASIHGPCAGIGSAISMACDLAIMSDEAFLYLAFANMSLVPDGGMSYHIVNAMGYKKAYQMFVEAQRISTDECLKYGLINKSCSLDDLPEVTQTWAEAIAKGAPLAQKHGKKILRNVANLTLEETINLESKTQISCSTSDDAATAITAFFNKEKPVFIGK